MKANHILPTLATGLLSAALAGAIDLPGAYGFSDAAPQLTDLVDSEQHFRFAVESSGGGSSQDELAKQLANPIANLVSVPFQNNFDFGAGPDGDGFQWKMNVQPVIPFSVSENWNLITRTIVPIVYQSDVGGTKEAPSGEQFGLQDTTFSAWLSPKAASSAGWVWGVGPVFYLPTGTDSDRGMGTSQWGAGPTAVFLRPGKATYGVLINHIWGFNSASNHIPGLSSTFVQPFVSYVPGGGWTFTLNTESTYNWRADDDELTVPINAGVAKMFKLGGVQAQWQLGARYYAVKQKTGPEWGLRAAVTLLFPQGAKAAPAIPPGK